MSTTLRSKVDVQLGWTWRDRVGPFVVTDENRLLFTKDLPDGSQAGEAELVWHAGDQVLAADESHTWELAALPQALFGDTIVISFARIKALLVVNRTLTGDGYLVLGGAETDQWFAPFGMLGDTVKVMPGSPLLLAHLGDGWPVEVGHEMLKLQAVGTSVTYDIAILGTGGNGSGSSSATSSSSSSSSSGSSSWSGM